MTQQFLSSKQNPNFWVRAYLWIKIVCHVIAGLITIATKLPHADQERKNILIQQWSRRLLNIFGIQLKVINPAVLPSSPFLLAGNHISWMDIHAINAFKPIIFVAKSDVERWPIFGWMAKQLGTIFIQRNNARHGRHIANEVSKVLEKQSVCIFPEGTSTTGDSVLPFKSNLFESAIQAEVPVYSLAISYKSENGARSDVAAFVGDMGLIESMANILRKRNLTVELVFLPPSGLTPSAAKDRKWLALHSQEAISAYIRGDQQSM